MSCKETTAKINKLLDEAEVLITDVVASRTSFIKYAEKKLEEISKVWSSKGGNISLVYVRLETPVSGSMTREICSGAVP